MISLNPLNPRRRNIVAEKICEDPRGDDVSSPMKLRESPGDNGMFSFSTLNVDNMSEEWFCPKPQNYWSMMAYNDSKLCNVLVANELARRWASRDILVFSCHPGNMVSSNISRHWCPYRLLFILVRPFTKSLEQAASTQVYCATAPELSDVSGLYFNNCCRCEPSKQAQNTQLSSRLWQLSLDFISSRFSSLDIPDKYRNKP
ncbi:hypothetical protein J6590_093173 [Homalodisca vitripennis]|nr:hypothetical protein J6590_093173 [Homalodisca vitripennis]